MSRPYAPLFRAITTSERLADLPNDAARLFYTWLLTVADDWGRVTARPRQLNKLVWPMLDRSTDQTEKAIESLRAGGLIGIFPSEDGPFVQILDHEEKSGSIGKRDHRKASHWPETALLAPLGPDWPVMARAGPARPSRAGARVCSVLELGSISSPSPEEIELPFEGKDFKELWARWKKFRKEKKKPLTEEQEGTQLKKLAAEGLFSATHRIERSIANGWQGLWMDNDPEIFTPENTHGTSKNRNDRRSDGTRPGEYAEPDTGALPRILRAGPPS